MMELRTAADTDDVVTVFATDPGRWARKVTRNKRSHVVYVVDVLDRQGVADVVWEHERQFSSATDAKAYADRMLDQGRIERAFADHVKQQRESRRRFSGPSAYSAATPWHGEGSGRDDIVD